MHPNDLQPGDVLLYSSQTLIGKLIRKLDGTDVTHAGIYLDNGMVGEALMVGQPGVHANPVATSFQGTNWIDVRRLSGRNLSSQPVMNVAQRYIADGNRYAYAEILLVAAICLTRKLNLQDSLLGKIAFKAMNKANSFIAQLTASGKQPMICSEFVFRCYDEADDVDDDPYSLEIGSQVSSTMRRRSNRRLRRRGFSAPSGDDLPNVHPDSLLGKLMRQPQKLERATMAAAPGVPPADQVSDAELAALIEAYVDAPRAGRAMAAAATPDVSPNDLEQAAADYAASLLASDQIRYGAPMAGPLAAQVGAAIADFVTPGDLLKSPSLRTIGRIS
ncbi:hypothetical protein [Planctomicrobium sp. SH664]|uniref:hypothetical protein n=1 Tax=Planctomicrobium sp. SH664 TaxID=3448125 RepID=UPI003F5AE737